MNIKCIFWPWTFQVPPTLYLRYRDRMQQLSIIKHKYELHEFTLVYPIYNIYNYSIMEGELIETLLHSSLHLMAYCVIIYYETTCPPHTHTATRGRKQAITFRAHDSSGQKLPTTYHTNICQKWDMMIFCCDGFISKMWETHVGNSCTFTLAWTLMYYSSVNSFSPNIQCRHLDVSKKKKPRFHDYNTFYKYTGNSKHCTGLKRLEFIKLYLI